MEAEQAAVVALTERYFQGPEGEAVMAVVRRPRTASVVDDCFSAAYAQLGTDGYHRLAGAGP